MKKFLILTLLLMVFTLSASAEQPAAEQYRQMFASGNFYVEYEVADKYRAKKTHIIRAGRYGQRIAKVGLKDKYPSALYRDGKYYRFTKLEEESSNIFFGSRGKSILRNSYVLDEDKLYSPTLDPDEHWQTVRRDLTLPEVFCIFFPNDPMDDTSQIFPNPNFNGSFKRKIDGKEYDCDQYINDIKSLAGTTVAQQTYNAFYDAGKLVRIQKYLLCNGKEFLLNDLIVHAISSEVPSDAFTIHKKFKLYAARNGDMKDLLDNLEQIGEIGGSVQ